MSPPGHAMGRALPPALPAADLIWARGVLRDVPAKFEVMPEWLNFTRTAVLWHHGLVEFKRGADGLMTWRRTPRGTAMLGLPPNGIRS